ncbi:hypothetical protein [Autumnicola musiva]|uniref:Peptidase M50 domain-containing protein n=1 Tax=Autumnicola musiva TaxID=3075589 RepID=A0ABU3D981_9FLAO|nr:hypothetical protein [Zunongwangia sp. F117]MDT0678100.1 hypothetical protein [Zunongwangia sp. F117]
MKIHIYPKELIISIYSFMAFTVIGTLTHQFGHIAVAEFLGYKSTLHFRSINYDNSILIDKIYTIYAENRTAIANDFNFKEKILLASELKKLKFHGFLVPIGGPLQTILTGLIGFIILIPRQLSIQIMD